MSKFNVNYRDLVTEFIPHFMRKPRMLSTMFSSIAALQSLNNNGVPVSAFGQLVLSLFQFQVFIRNFIHFDARTIYLEKYLNDIYDPVQKRIIITNDNTSHVLYLFNDAEQRAPVFFYNNWDDTINYIVDDRSVTGNKVYKATSPNLNDQPPSANWDFVKDLTFVFSKDDEFPVDYQIEIPLDVTLQPDYSSERIRSQIDLLNAAGRTYNGVQLGLTTNIFFTNIQ